MGSSLGTGGMETKIIAAELATAAGCATVITLGSVPSRILSIVQGHSSVISSPNSPGVEFATGLETLPPHTLFTPKPRPLTSRRFWILHGLTPRGSVYIDEGAFRAISRSERDGGSGGNGGRLLAAGVLRVQGNFAAGQAVRVLVVKGRWGRRRGGAGNGNDSDRGGKEGSRPVSPDHFADRKRHSSGSRDVAGERDGSVAIARLSLEDTAANGTITEGIELGEEENEEILEFGRGLTNYNSLEMDRIKGLKRCALHDAGLIVVNCELMRR